MRPDVGLVGKSTYSQKRVASLNCGRKLRCHIEYPERMRAEKNLIIIIILERFPNDCQKTNTN